jgi:NADH-quinone oxidoreductase subunit L
MGGLKIDFRDLLDFSIGSASLAALPFITGGFYSKDAILWLAFAGENGSIWFFLAALIGACITSGGTHSDMVLCVHSRRRENPCFPSRGERQ